MPAAAGTHDEVPRMQLRPPRLLIGCTVSKAQAHVGPRRIPLSRTSSELSAGKTSIVEFWKFNTLEMQP